MISSAGSRRTIVTVAVVVAGIRLWMQVRGKTTTPFGEWAVGWGALFFILSLYSEIAPQGAAMFSLIVATADVVKNGTSLFTDVSSVVTGAEKQGSSTVLSPTPFSGPASTTNSSNTSAKVS